MRVLKFRFWLKGKLQGILELKQNNILGMAWEWDKVDQFTGLFDNQGTEIYEGDLVRYIKGISHWGGGYTSAVEVKFETGSFYPFCGCGGEYSMDSKNAEIIGNIYENPELLK